MKERIINSLNNSQTWAAKFFAAGLLFSIAGRALGSLHYVLSVLKALQRGFPSY